MLEKGCGWTMKSNKAKGGFVRTEGSFVRADKVGEDRIWEIEKQRWKFRAGDGRTIKLIKAGDGRSVARNTEDGPKMVWVVQDRGEGAIREMTMGFRFRFFKVSLTG